MTFPQKSEQSTLSYGGREHGFYNIEALARTVAQNKPKEGFGKGLIFHSDRGRESIRELSMLGTSLINMDLYPV